VTNQVVTTLEQGAIPTAIAIIKAMQTFKNDLGTNPLLIPGNAGPAFLKFVSTVELTVPGLATTEWSAAGAEFDTKAESWIASLEAKMNPPTVQPAVAA